jgi:ABC-type spermidine/putrescine transport system permease subunit II
VRRHLGGIVLAAIVAVVCAFLLLPLVVVVPMSFSPTSYAVFPPEGLSTRWYEDFLGSDDWKASLWLSLRVGVATATCATVLGLMTATALARTVRRGGGILRLAILAPLIVPNILTAIGTYDMFTRLGLDGTLVGLVLGHTILALPFTTIILLSVLKGVDMTLEEAAQSLGASSVGAFMRVTLPRLAPALIGAFVVAFVTSWDEVVLALFLSGDTLTLPAHMFGFLTTQIRPTIAAVSTLLLAVVIVGMAVNELWRANARRRRRAPKLIAATVGLPPIEVEVSNPAESTSR